MSNDYTGPLTNDISWSEGLGRATENMFINEISKISAHKPFNSSADYQGASL